MNLIEQLRRFEGERRFVYQDHLGYWTIGAGILVDEREGGGLYPEEIQWLLENRIHRTRTDLVREIPWYQGLNEARRGVVEGMAFQMGVSGLLKFEKFLTACREQRWTKAAKEMLASLWATQTPRRATLMAKQMEEGGVD